MTIEQLEEHVVWGNAHSDRVLFERVTDFVINDHPMHDKCRALAVIDRAMGIDCPFPDPWMVREYIEEAGLDQGAAI